MNGARQASGAAASGTLRERRRHCPETLRKWIRQAEVDAAPADGTTTAATREVRELRRKTSEPEQTVAILMAATSTSLSRSAASSSFRRSRILEIADVIAVNTADDRPPQKPGVTD